MQQLGAYLEGIYRDFSEKSNRENMEKYYSILVEKLKSGIQMALAKGLKFTFSSDMFFSLPELSAEVNDLYFAVFLDLQKV